MVNPVVGTSEVILSITFWFFPYTQQSTSERMKGVGPIKKLFYIRVFLQKEQITVKDISILQSAARELFDVLVQDESVWELGCQCWRDLVKGAK